MRVGLHLFICKQRFSLSLSSVLPVSNKTPLVVLSVRIEPDKTAVRVEDEPRGAPSAVEGELGDEKTASTGIPRRCGQGNRCLCLYADEVIVTSSRLQGSHYSYNCFD